MKKHKFGQLRLKIVLGIAKILRVPIKVRETWWCGEYGVHSAKDFVVAK
jgi:hypothetical protein